MAGIIGRVAWEGEQVHAAATFALPSPVGGQDGGGGTLLNRRKKFSVVCRAMSSNETPLGPSPKAIAAYNRTDHRMLPLQPDDARLLGVMFPWDHPVCRRSLRSLAGCADERPPREGLRPGLGRAAAQHRCRR